MAPLDSPLPHTSVDAENPWLGLASFTEETQAYFYGREEEVAELARRVQRKTLTLLFGQSGLGKTSILGAGIVPKLRALGFCPVYLRIDYSPEAPSPSEQLKSAIFRATAASGQWTQAGVAVSGESLWEFLHHRGDVLHDASGRTLTPLLIFDQFEEIFTLAQGDAFGRARAAEFIDDLADLVENRPPKKLEAAIEQDEDAAERFDFTRSDYRVLIALREDYLAHLEAFKAVMPSITQNRMRLARMTGDQALAAVLKPGGKLVSREVAEAIVRFIAGGSELRNAEVEPSLLSLICRELNNARITQGRSEISADLLAGSHDTILAEFYERALADQPLAVRHFIEDELLTESGFRESIAEERVRNAFAAAGAAPDALATLVNRRLLRIEERLDMRRVELTHDVLCSVVRASRNLRREREARDAAERKLAEQRERERATRRALVRARKIAAVCGVLAIGAVASAIFGYVSMHRAQRAEALAQQTRARRSGETDRLPARRLLSGARAGGTARHRRRTREAGRRLLRRPAGGASHGRHRSQPGAGAGALRRSAAQPGAARRKQHGDRRRNRRSGEAAQQGRSIGNHDHRAGAGAHDEGSYRIHREPCDGCAQHRAAGGVGAEAADGRRDAFGRCASCIRACEHHRGFRADARQSGGSGSRHARAGPQRVRAHRRSQARRPVCRNRVRRGVRMADQRLPDARPHRRGPAGGGQCARGDAQGARPPSRRHAGVALGGTDPGRAHEHRVE